MKNALFKRLDTEVFQGLDKLKTHPNYQSILDFYTNLEDDQQKFLKSGMMIALFVIPMILVTFLFFQNQSLKSDFSQRVEIYKKANEILAKNQGVRDISSNIFSQNPIDSSEMIISKISSAVGPTVDLNKIKVSNFTSDQISSSIVNSQATFSFKEMSVNELMDTFVGLIRREKFRIQSIQIIRNENTNLLQGSFVGIHYSVVSQESDEE